MARIAQRKTGPMLARPVHPVAPPVRQLVAVLMTAVLVACTGGSSDGGTGATPTPPVSRTPTASPDASEPRRTPAPTRGATPTPADARLDLEGLRLELRPFARGLDGPVLLTHAGDGTGTLYAVEQGGRIRTMDGRGELASEPFLDISARLTAGGEQGLLGLAFHPRFGSNGRFYVNYTDRQGDTVIAEYRARGGRADRGSERVLLRVDQPYANHNGGHLTFGPDGLLYIALGDGGSSGDPHDNGQSRETLLGKLLRIDVDGGQPYGVPAGNPFVRTQGARREIWALGLRNPWRFSFDRETGALFIGDVGQGAFEEIDVEPPGSRGGLNYGWNRMEGDRCFRGDDCDRRGLTLPVAQYREAGDCAVTGGYVYRGERHERLRGAYLFADYCSGRIWALPAAEALRGPTDHRLVAETDGLISSFGEDESGELYLVDHGGTIFSIGPAR